MLLPSLNLIGPGRLGRSLARLWHDAGLLRIAGVVARQAGSAQDAIAFIGAGQAMTLAELPPADFTLIATPDDKLAEIVTALSRHSLIGGGDVVFHASGALSSELLAPLRTRSQLLASIHPLKSFAQPAHAITDFAGTYCGCEGNAEAVSKLVALFEGIAGQCFSLKAENKTLYHAGAVLACNDLVALMETALRCMSMAGLTREQAWRALRPLVDGSLANLDRLPTDAALTGPIARGDTGTVARQLAAVRQFDPAVADTYLALGRVALQLAALDETQRSRLAALLETSP
ncbi:DUF2520 domain-containing protein [Chitinimonas arctica]|uniref:DUF2520 domain-containing protein n=1 Tax=Chitinimonas arctica TaxID=2594795 RepID=A0A516SDJ9_9NEIS|nr:Rossmann-like and DUF2520 domain-containing protein [Chitinimonas arctica]QDQ26219.1 DUF2520 domain-containing protein [Chitinimonas arctica]